MFERVKSTLFENHLPKAVVHNTYGLALVYIRRSLIVLVLLISLLLVIVESYHTHALCLICILILLCILIHIIDCLLVTKEFDTILHHGHVVRGKLLSFVYHHGRRGFPCFEFEDQTGSHKVVSLLPMMVSKKESKRYVSTYYNLWYDPDDSAYVLYGNYEPEPVPAHYFGYTLLSQMAVALVFLMVLFFVCSPTNLTTGNLKTSWTSSYMPSSYNQSAIDCDTVQWFCTTYAVPTNSIGHDHAWIGGVDPKDFSHVLQVKQDLLKNYGICDRKSAIEYLDSILDHGSRLSYIDTVTKLNKQDLFELSRNEYLEKVSSYQEDYRYLAIYDSYHENKTVGIDAYDYCNSLELLGCYYVCGYISLEECLSHSLPIARKLQSEFTSWKSLWQNYLYGYQYNKKIATPDVTTEYQLLNHSFETLLSDDNASKQVSYDIPLVDNWSP